MGRGVRRGGVAREWRARRGGAGRDGAAERCVARWGVALRRRGGWGTRDGAGRVVGARRGRRRRRAVSRPGGVRAVRWSRQIRAVACRVGGLVGEDGDGVGGAAAAEAGEDGGGGGLSGEQGPLRRLLRAERRSETPRGIPHSTPTRERVAVARAPAQDAGCYSNQRGWPTCPGLPRMCWF